MKTGVLICTEKNTSLRRRKTGFSLCPKRCNWSSDIEQLLKSLESLIVRIISRRWKYPSSQGCEKHQMRPHRKAPRAHPLRTHLVLCTGLGEVRRETCPGETNSSFQN